MEIAVKLMILALAVPGCAAVFAYVFLLKGMARLQNRLGPMEAGPAGILQPVADGIKFIQKEDLIPKGADKLVFTAAPIVTMVSAFLMFVVIPLSSTLVVVRPSYGLVILLAASALSIFGVLMAGWASANKYSLLGSLRAAAQVLAYEIPLVLAAFAVGLQAESFDLVDIVNAQHSIWFILPQIVAFILFCVAVQAELMQNPFDMPLADTEIVAGYMTEYSGFKFLMFYISELAATFAFSAVAATLFLGGWKIPLVDLGSGALAAIIGAVVLLLKTLLLSAVIFWVRFSLPRLREDRLQVIAWKVMIPLSIVNLALTGVFKVIL